MFELGVFRSRNHLLEQVRSSCRIYLSRISKIDHLEHIHYLAWYRTHRNGVMAVDGAFAVGVDESPEIVKRVDRNTCR